MLQESKMNELEYQRLSKEEMEERGILGRLVGICADFVSPTRNGRKYPEKLWENVFDDPIMKERIDNGVCYGELGHPADREETDMEKIAVCMAEQPKKGQDGKLRAVFDILNTPNGRILKSLCDYGSTLGISSRGSGDLETDFDGNESVNPDTYTCEGFDVVLIPAVKDARLEYVNESLEKKRYNKTLRQKLTESIKKETKDHQKVISESLNTLGIQLNEDRPLSSKDFYFANENQEFEGDPQELYATELQKLSSEEIEQVLDSAPVGSTIHDIYDIYWTKKALSEGKTPDEAIVEKRQSVAQNYSAPVPTKYHKTYWSISGSEYVYILKVILGKDKYYTVSDGVTFSLDESVDTEVQKNTKENIIDNDDAKLYMNGEDMDVAHEEPVEEAFEMDKKDLLDKEETLEDKDTAADRDRAIVEELQKALKLNKKLDEKITSLQEKLSVSYTKEMKLTEDLERYKAQAVKLSESLNANKVLSEKLKKINGANTAVNEQCKQLTESVNKRDDKIKELKESVSRKNEAIKSLQGKVHSLNETLEKQHTEYDGLSEKYNTLNKDYQQFKENYSRKIEQQNSLIEKYKGIAAKSVNKYIDNQAVRLGVQPAEIKNRLPESYSFSDIDRICEDLQEYKLNISNLPFTSNSRLNEDISFRAKNVDSRTLIPTEDDIDELTLRLAGL